MEYTSPRSIATSAGFSAASTNPTKTPGDQQTPITTPDALESYVAAEGNDDVPNWDRPTLEPTGDVALDSGGDPEPEYGDDADEASVGSSDEVPSPDRTALESTVDAAANPQDENRAVGSNGEKASKRGWFGGILRCRT